MKKIKIAHLLYILGPAGKEKGLLRIVSRINRSRFDVDIIVFFGVHHLKLIDLENVNVIELKPVKGHSLRLVPQLVSIFKKNQYDIIYTHSWNTLLEGYVAALLAKIPVKIHGEHGTFERSFFKDLVQKLIWRNFDVLTAVAGDLKKRLKTNFSYHKNNIQVIYNGTDHRIFVPSEKHKKEIRRQFGLDNYFIVGTIGRYYPVKDHFTLIRGFKRFASDIAQTRLMLVGGGGKIGERMKRRYDKLVKKIDAEKEVLFVPAVPDPEAMMNAFDVFVLSSISEGCSNVILEAMACGIPVVATRTGGNPELVRENETGLLFEVGPDGELAEKLKLLYSRPDLRRTFSQNSVQLVQEQFSLEQSVKNYENLYIELYQQKVNREWQKLPAGRESNVQV